MSQVKVKIKFTPSFMWNVLGQAQVFVDNQFIEETKKESLLNFTDSQKHLVHLKFEKKTIQTDAIKIEARKSMDLEVICGIKYQSIREGFKYIIYAGLIFFYYFIIKINNREITNDEYRIYFFIGILVFVVFCLESLFAFLFNKNPHKFIYLKQIDHKNSK